MSGPPEDIPGSSKQAPESSDLEIPCAKKLRHILQMRDKLVKRRKELEGRVVDWDDELREEQLYNEEMEITRTVVDIEKKLLKYKVLKDLPEECRILLEGGTDLNVVITDTGDELLNERITKALREKCDDKNSVNTGIYLVRDELDEIFAKVREEQLARELPRPLPAKEDRSSYEELMRNVSLIINRSVKEAKFSKRNTMFDDYLTEEELEKLAEKKDEGNNHDEAPALPMNAILGIIREKGEEEQRNGVVEEEGEEIQLSDSDDAEKEDGSDDEEDEKDEEMEKEERAEEKKQERVEEKARNGDKEKEEVTGVDGEEHSEDRSLDLSVEDNASIILSSDHSMSENSKKDDDPHFNLDVDREVITLSEDEVPASPIRSRNSREVFVMPKDDDDRVPFNCDDYGEPRLFGYGGLETISIIPEEPIASSSNKENNLDELLAAAEMRQKTARNDLSNEDVIHLDVSIGPEDNQEADAEGEDETKELNAVKLTEEEEVLLDTPDNVSSLSTKPSWMKGETSAELAASFVAHTQEAKDDLEVVFERISELPEPKFEIEPQLERRVKKWIKEGAAALSEPVPVIDISDDEEEPRKETGEGQDIVDEEEEQDGRGTKRANSGPEESPPARRPRLDEAAPCDSA